MTKEALPPKEEPEFGPEPSSLGGKMAFKGLNDALARLKAGNMKEAEMLETLEQFFAWASTMSIEFARMGEGPREGFELTFARMTAEIKPPFQEQGLGKKFQEILEAHRAALNFGDRPTTPTHISQKYDPEVYNRETVKPPAEIPQPQALDEQALFGSLSVPPPDSNAGSKPLVQPLQFEKTVLASPESAPQPKPELLKSPEFPRTPRTPKIQGFPQNSDISERWALIRNRRIQVAIVAGVMAGIGGIIGMKGADWTADKSGTASASAPAATPAPRARTSTDKVKKIRYEVAADKALDIYIDQLCKQGPQILCDTLNAAKEKTVIESHEYESDESADLRIKRQFLKNLEEAVREQKTEVKQSKEAALSFIRVQQRYLRGYEVRRKWTSEEAAKLLKNVRPEEVTQPENKTAQ